MLLWVAVILGTGAAIYYLFRRIKRVRDGSTSRPTQPNNGETANPDEDLSSEAEDAWRRKDYERLLQLLEKDSPFPVGFRIEEVFAEQSIRKQLKKFVEGRERLHGFIRVGDLDSIREFIRSHKSSVYYSTDNVSALSRAIECDKREICSYLSSIRPNFRIPELLIEESNWSQDPEKSHIHKLVHVMRFSDMQDREECHAVVNMFLELDKFDEISWLMKTIEHENFELTFAIKSESVTTDVFGISVNSFGYTEKNGRILIAGKGIATAEGYKNVYRKFAHELCHLAMHYMYRNSFNPYHPHDKERKSDFSIICNEIHKKREAMDELIQKVYWYGESEWESELIVRVPEILAVHGEEKAIQIFSEQIPKVYEYYKKHISKDSAEFSQLKFYSPELLNLGNISDDHLAVRRSEMCISPFVRTENYEDYLIPIEEGEKSFSLLPTSNPKLAALHVFHAFKGICPLHTDRRVLAFHLEYYYVDGNNSVIYAAYDDSFLQKLILVLPDNKDERGKIFDDIFFSSKEEKEVIVVVSEALWKRHPEWNVEKQLEYHWNGLSKDYQDKLFEKKIVYQGEKRSPWSVLKDVEIPRVFTPDVLWYFMSKTDVRIGEGFSSDWNERELYVERMFFRFEYKKENFRKEKSPLHYFFVTGVSEKDLQTITSMKGQTIESEDEIQEEKYIFLPKLENDNANLFRKLFCKIKEKQNSIYWVNYEDGKFLLRDSLGGRDDIKDYFVEDAFNEYQILRETQGMNVILVADEPGAGKSTSIFFLMKEMKRKYPEKLICRVNFSEHLNEFSDSPSLPSLLKFLQQVFKMNTPLEEMTFQAIIGVPRRVVVFFDEFDEMTKELQSKAMKSLQLLREETKIQIWIFTRKHERLTLEEEMNTVSFSLRQFSLDDQRIYLNKVWVHLISLNLKNKDSDEKFQEILNNLENYSEKCGRLLESMKELVNIRKENQGEFLKKLDFNDYSLLVINSVQDIILKGKFMVPLQLWMTTNIIIDSNFKIPDQNNRFTFYNKFLDEIVDSYLRDKCGIQPKKKIYNRERKRIFENLWNFFARVMQPELYNYDLKKEDLEELVDIGLLRKEGEHYHFSHMTFVEFFLSQMIEKEIESEKVRSVKAKFLSDVLLKESYREVRLSLDDFVEKLESQSFIFPKSLLQGFNLVETYSEFCRRIQDMTDYRIWRRIFQDSETHMIESLSKDFISKILDYSPLKKEIMHTDGVIDVLNSTLTDRLLFVIFDSRVDVSHKFIFRCLKFIKSNDLKAMIRIFEKISNYKKSSQNSGICATDNSLGNIKVGLKIFEKEYKDENSNSVLHLMTERRKGKVLEDLTEIQRIIGNGQFNKLLTMQDKYGMTMLHLLMHFSEDPKDVTAVLELVEGVMEEELFMQFLTQKDNKGIFPISCANLHIMKDILEFMGRYFSNQGIIDMLKKNKERLGKSIRETECALEEILYLKKILGSELFEEILISKDGLGETRLHWLMLYRKGEKLFCSDLKVYASLLDSDSMRAFLFFQNIIGDTFLHKWSLFYIGSQYILRELHSILSRDAIEYLLNIRNNRGETLIHLYRRPISELSFLDEFLGKKKFIELVTVENSNEDNVLQGNEDTCHVQQDPPELDISEPFTPPLEDDQDEPQRNRNHYHLIEELPELYMSITLPYLEKEPLYLKWVYDVIKGEAERERVVYESPCKDDKNGFVMIRDAEWDGEDLERLHFVALPYRPGLLTIRDLKDTHLILLKNIYNIGKEVIEEKYGVPGTQLNIYLQYLPSFYHLNIHFTMLRNETCGFEVQKNHLLAYVINNLELWPDYYQKATLMLPLQESHNLFFRFKNMGSLED